MIIRGTWFCVEKKQHTLQYRVPPRFQWSEQQLEAQLKLEVRS